MNAEDGAEKSILRLYSLITSLGEERGEKEDEGQAGSGCQAADPEAKIALMLPCQPGMCVRGLLCIASSSPSFPSCFDRHFSPAANRKKISLFLSRTESLWLQTCLSFCLGLRVSLIKVP